MPDRRCSLIIAKAGIPESKAVFKSSFKPTFSPSMILRCKRSSKGSAANSAARLSLVVVTLIFSKSSKNLVSGS